MKIRHGNSDSVASGLLFGLNDLEQMAAFPPFKDPKKNKKKIFILQTLGGIVKQQTPARKGI